MFRYARIYIRALNAEGVHLVQKIRDVFVRQLKAVSLEPKAEEQLFLNNALLESGHAVRYDGGAKEE